MSARVQQPQWLPTELGLGSFNPSATRVTPDGAVLAGYLRAEEDTLDTRRAAIYWLGARESQLVYEEEGWIVAMEAGEAGFWAVAARKGPVFRLLSSRDGREWKEVGPIPAASITQIAQGDELWAMGAGTLVKSSDGGSNWHPVTGPRQPDSTRDHVIVQPGTLLLAGTGIAATTDAGATWRAYPTPDGEVTAIWRSLVALRSKGRVQLAAMEASGLAPLVEFQKDMDPYRLCAEGDLWQFLAVPLGAEIGQGVFHYVSGDGGQTWDASLIACRPQDGAADVSPSGRGVAVDVDGRVLVLKP